MGDERSANGSAENEAGHDEGILVTVGQNCVNRSMDPGSGRQ